MRFSNELDILSYEEGYADGFDNGIKAVMQQLTCIENYEELKKFVNDYWEEESNDEGNN